MKILLTARGFVGGVLEQRLKALHHKVVVMGRDYDIRNKDSFTKVCTQPTLELVEGRTARTEDYINDIDLVIHNASVVSSLKGLDDPHTTYDTNLMGTVNALEFCREKRTPIIFISSCKVAPNTRGAYGSYGVSKVAGELIVKDYWKIYGVPYIIVRPASIYGISQDGTSALGWITWFIKAALHNYPVNIEGDGEQLRDSIHVDDLVELLTKMSPTFYEGANGVYEAGLGLSGSISVNWLVEHLQDKTGKPLMRKFVATRKGDPYSLVMHPEKTTSTWDWKPKIGIVQGIDRIYDYYQKHPELFQRT